MKYFVDSEYGCDTGDGCSRQTAFRTTTKVNQLKLKAGDQILFKAGCSYLGTLKLSGETGAGIIVVTRYGVGDKPHIIGDDEAAVDIVDISGIEIRDLSVSNPEGLFGIRIINTKGGEMNHIHIMDCDISDVYGGHDRFYINTGGIVMTTGKDKPGWFRNLLIQDNHIENVCRTGIILHTYWSNRPWKTWAENEYISDKENWWPSYEVVIRGNFINRPAGDAIVIIGAISPLIEWNTAYEIMADPNPPCANAGIWPQSTEDCVVQYNEVGYAHKPEGCNDAQGFDVDLSCRNTIIQYNYSHDNEGGFLLLCELGETDSYGYTGTVVRNNLSVNDGNSKGEVIALVGPVRGVTIENNTIYSSGNVERIVEVWTKDGKDQAKDITFRNNIFVSNGRNNLFNLSNAENFTFENNLYWGTHRNPQKNEIAPIVADPHLVKDGDSGCGRKCASNYAPSSDSVAITKGATALRPASKDFFGNTTSDKDYIGAFLTGPIYAKER